MPVVQLSCALTTTVVSISILIESSLTSSVQDIGVHRCVLVSLYQGSLGDRLC